uniref:Uncharacterized protein n=1 Tax=Arundo donax TaxID=35708 RepID=A0A0A9E4P3_ARUDO
MKVAQCSKGKEGNSNKKVILTRQPKRTAVRHAAVAVADLRLHQAVAAPAVDLPASLPPLAAEPRIPPRPESRHPASVTVGTPPPEVAVDSSGERRTRGAAAA